MSLKRHLRRMMLMIVISVTAPTMTAMAEEHSQKSVQQFDSFAGIRTELLSRIGGATKRVWISTNFLTDAEIVSSLYIAQYRKVQISVLLGKEKASNILSRLGYLKQVNIPVAIRPKNFYADRASLVLLDDTLFSIDTDLDYLAKHNKFTIKELESTEIPSFEASFQEAAKNPETPEVRPLPLVGSQRAHKSHIHSPKTNEAGTNEAKSGNEGRDSRPPALAGSGTSADNVYRYRRVKDRPAAGVPTKLPKMTLGQELEKKRAASGNQTDPEAASTP